MSLILDALRKLDREKSSRRTAANLAAEILKTDLARPGKGVLRPLGAVALAVVVTAAMTYALVVQFGLLSKSSLPVPLKTPAPGEPAAPAALPADPSPSSAGDHPAPGRPAGPVAAGPKPLPLAAVNPPASNLPAAPPLPSPQPAHEPRAEASPTPPKAQSNSESRKTLPSVVEERPGQAVIPRETEASPPPGNASQSAAHNSHGQATARPEFKLSGVVWHEEPAQRRAMINGVIATEGAVVEGVKIMEIQPSRVRLLHNDRPFEITIE